MDETTGNYISPLLQRYSSVILMLPHHLSAGISPKEIADYLHISQASVTRDLANLQKSGIAERVQRNGKKRVYWRLTLKMAQIAYPPIVNQLRNVLDAFIAAHGGGPGPTFDI